MPTGAGHYACGVSEQTIVPGASRAGRWLAQRRLKVALAIAVGEGILVALEGVSRWVVIAIALPTILFYLLKGGAVESDAGRQLAWIAAASQALAVLVAVLAFFIGLFVLLVATLFALLALVLLYLERPR